jgi:hypothetical protein
MKAIQRLRATWKIVNTLSPGKFEAIQSLAVSVDSISRCASPSVPVIKSFIDKIKSLNSESAYHWSIKQKVTSLKSGEAAPSTVTSEESLNAIINFDRVRRIGRVSNFIYVSMRNNICMY